jgi:prevent-host-death family protein
MKTTRSAGVREAKARLSELLRDVQLGREWTITERGKPVARLVPATAQRGSIGERLKRLEEIGVIERRTRPCLPLPPPLPLAEGLAQQMLTEDRGA